MTVSWSIRLLGGAVLERDGIPASGPPTQRHRLALLAVLACAHPRPVPRERAMVLLWPERDGRRARALLNLSVHVLRGALGPCAIRLHQDALSFDASSATCDVIAFREALESGDDQRAVEMYAGPLLDGFRPPASPELERWLEDERAALAARCSRALRTLADEARQGGHHQISATYLARQLEIDPYSSRSALALAESHEARGDHGEAVHTLERHLTRLREDLAVRPPAAVLELLDRLRGGPAVHASSPSAIEERREKAVFLTARARHFVGRRDADSLRTAIGYFERARAADRTYAPAYAGLADAWSLLGFYDVLPPSEAFSHARAAAHRAVSLDPSSPDGHASLGYVLMYYHWQWERAERSFRRAIALDPSHALSHQWLGNCLALLGRAPEASEMMRRSRALAPASAIANAAYGWALYFAGHFDHATDLQLESLELDPAFPVAHLWLGQSLARLRRFPEAIAALRKASELFGRSDAAEAALARGLAEAGDGPAAREVAARLQDKSHSGGYAPAYEIAKIHAALGERDHALDWLDRAHAQRSHSVAFLRVDPEIAELRSEARGAALVGRVGLV
ncbi:MAG TPA: tetratricopeptide repeat protein [Gemmatimonadales bacterium]